MAIVLQTEIEDAVEIPEVKVLSQNPNVLPPLLHSGWFILEVAAVNSVDPVTFCLPLGNSQELFVFVWLCRR